ncbi:hydroxypyruvate isomerase family protein [Litorisediminicola beolgyonensis]|uniref:Hydroxypyruvate isomerase family protein n=1 Tax=Litorisediminicola beolgyonensis TaxID=1173614 RepID=A0ABW3ZDU7_9RHOB
MKGIAANITLLEFGLPVLERPRRAAELGFDAIECLFPYDLGRGIFAEALDGANLALVLINTPVSGWDHGDRGRAAVPGEAKAFRKELKQAMRYAKSCGAPMLHIMSGTTDAPGARDTLVDNLRAAADAQPDLTLTIEPLNPGDAPGYWLNSFERAAEVLDAVDRPNVALQFDSWHAHRIHGDAAGVWREHGHRAAHVQIAGLDGRGAPDPGHPEEARLYAAMVESVYDGWVSVEYPDPDPQDAEWLSTLRSALAA